MVAATGLGRCGGGGVRALDVMTVRAMVPGVAGAAGGLLYPVGQIDRWEAAMRRAAGR